MSIPLTGTGGLFTRWGAQGNAYLNAVGFMAAADPSTTASWGSGNVTIRHVEDAIANIDAQYLATDQNLRDGLYAAKNDVRGSLLSYQGNLVGMASATVVQMADEAVSLTALTLPLAVDALTDQMIGAGNISVPDTSVKKNTVSVTIAASSGNTGNVNIISSLVDPITGVNREYVFPETIELVVTTDGQTGGTAGSETISFAGELPAASQAAWNYPLGSGCSGSITVTDPSVDAGSNLLTNSDFNTIPAGVPTGWDVLVGTTGTSILAGGTSYLSAASNCLKYTGGASSELTSIRQLMTGMLPNAVYAILAYTKVDDAAATGVLAFSLCNGQSHAILTDNAGTSNSLSVDLGPETTSWAAHSAFFRTPKVMPSTVEIKVHLTTTLNNTHSAFVQFGMCVPVLAYVGGPWMAGFRASIDPIIGDKLTNTVANDLGGKFQTLVGMRWFDMRGMGKQFPSSANGTIAETLVTA